MNVFLALVPSKDSEKSFHQIFQKTATTGRPTDSCQLVVQLAPAHTRSSVKCFNTNTSELLKQCVCTVGRPAFSCNSNHQFMFSSKKNEQGQILPLSQGNWKMQSRLKWPSCVAEVDHADVRIPSWGNEDGRNLKNCHVRDIS